MPSFAGLRASAHRSLAVIGTRNNTGRRRIFDKPHRLTVSGVHRGKQRQLYDQRKRSAARDQGYKLVAVSLSGPLGRPSSRAGTTRPRWLAHGARIPWYRTWCGWDASAFCIVKPERCDARAVLWRAVEHRGTRELDSNPVPSAGALPARERTDPARGGIETASMKPPNTWCGCLERCCARVMLVRTAPVHHHRPRKLPARRSRRPHHGQKRK